MSSRSHSTSSLGSLLNYNATRNIGLHMNNTDQAGANWARMVMNRNNLTTVTNLRWLIGHMYHHSGPSRWYRGGRREIMKRIDRIRNRRVSAARTAAVNLRRKRRLSTIKGLVNRETGMKRR